MEPGKWLCLGASIPEECVCWDLPARGPQQLGVQQCPEGAGCRWHRARCWRAALQGYQIAQQSGPTWIMSHLMLCWTAGDRNASAGTKTQVPGVGLGTVFQQAMAKKWFHSGQLTANGSPLTKWLKCCSNPGLRRRKVLMRGVRRNYHSVRH